MRLCCGTVVVFTVMMTRKAARFVGILRTASKAARSRPPVFVLEVVRHG
jgi:hypothetical protein